MRRGLVVLALVLVALAAAAARAQAQPGLLVGVDEDQFRSVKNRGAAPVRGHGSRARGRPDHAALDTRAGEDLAGGPRRPAARGRAVQGHGRPDRPLRVRRPHRCPAGRRSARPVLRLRALDPRGGAGYRRRGDLERGQQPDVLEAPVRERCRGSARRRTRRCSRRATEHSTRRGPA